MRSTGKKSAIIARADSPHFGLQKSIPFWDYPPPDFLLDLQRLDFFNG
jgi:hypothetical protein